MSYDREFGDMFDGIPVGPPGPPKFVEPATKDDVEALNARLATLEHVSALRAGETVRIRRALLAIYRALGELFPTNGGHIR